MYTNYKLIHTVTRTTRRPTEKKL